MHHAVTSSVRTSGRVLLLHDEHNRTQPYLTEQSVVHHFFYFFTRIPQSYPYSAPERGWPAPAAMQYKRYSYCESGEARPCGRWRAGTECFEVHTLTES